MHLLKTLCAGAWRNYEERFMFDRYVMFSSRTQCITCLHILGCSRKTICTYMHVLMYMPFKYRRIAQVSAVAFTMDFPNEWTQIIPRILGMLQIWPWNAVTFPKCWGLVALDSVLGKPQWWYHGDTMWSCRVIRGEPGEVWLSMEVTQHLLNSGTWGLYLCMLWLQVRSRSQSA